MRTFVAVLALGGAWAWPCFHQTAEAESQSAPNEYRVLDWAEVTGEEVAWMLSAFERLQTADYPFSSIDAYVLNMFEYENRRCLFVRGAPPSFTSDYTDQTGTAPDLRLEGATICQAADTKIWSLPRVSLRD